MRSRTFVTIALIALVAAATLMITSCTSADSSDSSKPDQSHANAPLGSSENAEEPAAVFEEEPMHVSPVQVTGTETAVIQTSKGEITLEFYPADAPNTVASFIELADAGFYNGLKFHRVVPGFVVQGGDPLTRDLSAADIQSGTTAAGTGGPGWNQKAEFNSRKHETGTLAMARSRDVDSAGSQFYICLAPQPSLDGQYTVFGQVTGGMDVVMSIQVGDVIESVVIRR